MIPFEIMPPDSKIWIYQSNREFSEQEAKNMENKSISFLDQWTSHGKTMNAAVEILYNRFIIICVDEQTAPASGCGIDKSVHFIRQLEKDHALVLLNRTLVAYKKENTIAGCTLSEFEAKIQGGEVNENTIVFNNMVSTKREMESNWQIPLKNSWQARLMV